MWNAKTFDKAVKALPKLYSTDGIKAENKTIAMHLFIGGSDWYVCEGDANEGLLFGFACLNQEWGFAEWGYASIEELKAIRVRGVEVDFDLHWKPTRFADIPQIRENVHLEEEAKPSKEKPFREVIGEETLKTLLKAGMLIENSDGSFTAPLPPYAPMEA